MIMCSELYAQTESRWFQRITQEQGLSDPTAFSIFQDTRGFMWFGTVDGLNRFDGYSVVVYRHEPTDSNTIADNFVRGIHEDSRGTGLWIGTRSGLEQFDPVTEKFRHYEITPNPKRPGDNEVRVIYEDRAGNLWVGAKLNGLHRFERSTGTFQRFPPDPPPDSAFAKNSTKAPTNSLSQYSVSAIYEDPFGMLWLGTVGGGLKRFNPGTGEFRHFLHDPRDANSLSSNNVLALYGDSARGALWIGMHGGGLNKLVLAEVDSVAPGREKFVRVQHDPADANSLSDNRIFIIRGDSTGALWVGTFAGGLNKFDPVQKIWSRFQNDPL